MNYFSFTDNDEYLSEQLVTYIGNKRKLLPFIESAIVDVASRLNYRHLSSLDGFAGSGVVSRMLKRHCHTLHSNDLETYAWVIGSCYLTAQDAVPPGLGEAIADLNARKLRSDLGIGLVEAIYAPRDDGAIEVGERAFYTNRNARIIDNIRRSIDEFPAALRPFLIAPLLHKASVHANTSGVFKGFYKNTATGRGQFGGNAQNCLVRILKDIELTAPIFSQDACKTTVHRADINILAQSEVVDVAYYDPPYNQHPYGSNYFMLNLIADYQPIGQISKVSGIPAWNRSVYNKRGPALIAFSNLIRDTQAKFVVVSYSNEGLLTLEELRCLFAQHGAVEVRQQRYAAFRGSRNLGGRKKTVDELLFIIDKR